MSNPPATFRTAREETIDALCRQFADDSISMPELERRLTRARSARTRAELNELLSDLPGHRVPTRTVQSPTPAASAEPTTEGRGEEANVRTSSHLAFAIMGGTRRAGRWAPPRDMVAVAIMGGVELDFRDAVLEPGSVTEINCFAFWGGVEITVPPQVHVDTHGLALLGGFDQSAELTTSPPPDAPVIRVNGLALMGGVEVKVRAPGESPGRRGTVAGGGRSELPRSR